MTACVKNHSKRVALAISASLVGALTLGAAAPAVAFASNDGVQMLVADTTDSLAGGAITEYTDQDGDAVDSLEFTYNGNDQYIVPTAVKPRENSPFDLPADGYKLSYYKVVDSVEKASDVTPDGEYLHYINNTGKGIQDEGTYVVAVLKDGAKGAIEGAQLKFKIVGNKLENAKIVKADDHDSSDFVYDGETFDADSDWGLMLGQDQLTMNTNGGLGSFQIYRNGEPVKDNAPVEAGDYTIRISGADQYAGQNAEIPFTIKAIDLSTAAIEYANSVKDYGTVGNALPNYVSNIGGLNFVEVQSQGIVNGRSAWRATAGDNNKTKVIVTLEFVAAESTEATPNGTAGRYVYKLTAANEDGTECTNVTGERTITVVRYDKQASIEYDGEDTIAAPEETKHYDKDYIDVRTSAGKKLDYTVEYLEDTDGDGVYETAVEESATAWPGKYQAVITVADDTYEWGGQGKVNFEVAAVEIKEADAYVTYKGEAFDDGDVVDVYSGEDLMANLAISAYDQDGEKLPADAFDLEVKDEDGNLVTELVDAGDYTATIKEKDESFYRLEDGADPTVEFTVSPVTITGAYDKIDGDNSVARFVGTLGYGDDADQTFAYTGSAIVPSFEYDIETGSYEGTDSWKALPADSYKATFTKKGDTKKLEECVEPGWYTMHVSDSAKDGNYTIEFDVNFQISSDRVFNDVENDEWYSEYVYEAAKNSWMTGFDGTNFFGPDQQITRGDVAVVLWKMAGKPQPQGAPSDGSEDWYTEQGGWNTGFGDVNGKMYYAEAIAWAKSAELVTGYDGTDSYRPDAFISRQELATMLGRYAEKCKVDVEGAEADLSAYADASSVAPFAEEYVEYAVSAKVMGQDVTELRPADDITRAEVAAMVVRLSGQFDFDLML